MAEQRPTDQLPVVPVDEALTLVVAWRIGEAFELRRVEMTREVANALRDPCRATIARLEGLDARPYGSDIQLEREEYMVVPEDVLADAETVAGGLRRAAGLDSLAARDLPSRGLAFYAVAVGNDPERRSVFVRKIDPARVARPGWVVATLGETLRRVEDPVFVFDDRFDLLLLPEGALVLNQSAFELLFREVPSLAGRYETWVNEIAERLPFEGDGAQQLVEAASRDSRLWRRLRSIHERGHLAHVQVQDIRDYAKQQGIDAAALIRGDKLIFDGANRFDLLKLLNEDLFVGGLTGERFEADRKTSRPG